MSNTITSEHINNCLKNGMNLHMISLANVGAQAAFSSILEEMKNKIKECDEIQAELKFRLEQNEKGIKTT